MGCHQADRSHNNNNNTLHCYSEVTIETLLKIFYKKQKKSWKIISHSFIVVQCWMWKIMKLKKKKKFWLTPIFKNIIFSISVLANNFLIWKYVFTLGSERDLTEQQQHQKLKQYKKNPQNPLTVRIGEIKESWKKLHCDYKTEEEGTEKKWWNSWIKTQTVRTPFKITSWKTVRNSHLYHFMWNGEKLPLRSLHVKLWETPFNIISCETVRSSL